MRFARGQRKMASTLHKCLENTIQHKKERNCRQTGKGNCERKSSFCKIECNFVAFDFLMATTERKLKLLSCVLCVCVVWEFMYLLVLVRVCVCAISIAPISLLFSILRSSTWLCIRYPNICLVSAYLILNNFEHVLMKSHVVCLLFLSVFSAYTIPSYCQVNRQLRSSDKCQAAFQLNSLNWQSMTGRFILVFSQCISPVYFVSTTVYISDDCLACRCCVSSYKP